MSGTAARGGDRGPTTPPTRDKGTRSTPGTRRSWHRAASVPALPGAVLRTATATDAALRSPTDTGSPEPATRAPGQVVMSGRVAGTGRRLRIRRPGNAGSGVERRP